LDRLNDRLEAAELLTVGIDAERHMWVFVPDDFGDLVFGDARISEGGDGRAPQAVEVETITAGDLIDID
jgi:hypothetical protein